MNHPSDVTPQKTARPYTCSTVNSPAPTANTVATMNAALALSIPAIMPQRAHAVKVLIETGRGKRQHKLSLLRPVRSLRCLRLRLLLQSRRIRLRFQLEHPPV